MPNLGSAPGCQQFPGPCRGWIVGSLKGHYCNEEITCGIAASEGSVLKHRRWHLWKRTDAFWENGRINTFLECPRSSKVLATKQTFQSLCELSFQLIGIIPSCFRIYTSVRKSWVANWIVGLIITVGRLFFIKETNQLSMISCSYDQPLGPAACWASCAFSWFASFLAASASTLQTICSCGFPRIPLTLLSEMID